MFITVRTAGLVVLGLVLAGSLPAQATRTWVSGVGDDANPCDRTAPCKTFAGAISKTTAGGEIDVLDSGGFGTLTITKSITIEGAGAFGSVLAVGTSGITINAGVNDMVTLRNLSINGNSYATPGIRGIRFLAGKELIVENCEIFKFSLRDISIESSTPNAVALITNTTVRDGGSNGIAVVPPIGITNQVVLNNVRSVGNVSYGVAVAAGGMMQIRNSNLSNNTGGGLWVDVGTVTVDSSVIGGNTMGLSASNGANVMLNNVSLTENVTGATSVGATILSFGNNQIAANLNVNTLAMSLLPRQ